MLLVIVVCFEVGCNSIHCVHAVNDHDIHTIYVHTGT